MHATLLYGDRDIRFEEVPDPVLLTGDDAIVRVVAACVRGSGDTVVVVGDGAVGLCASARCSTSRGRPGARVRRHRRVDAAGVRRHAPGWAGRLRRVPNLNPELKLRPVFGTNVGIRRGVAPVRSYVAELLPEVLDGRLTPGAVFDLELPLSDVAEAYAAMDERRAIKVLLGP